MTRLLVDCTFVFNHPELNTGIQRVVRNIINHFPSLRDEVACVPIIFKQGEMLEVKKLAPKYADAWYGRWHCRLEALAQKFAHKLTQIRLRYWRMHARLFRWLPWSPPRIVQRAANLGFHVLSMSFILPLYFVEWILEKIEDRSRTVGLECRADDILVLLDSSWHTDFFPIVEKLQRQGMPIVSVIYDLIPLTHPQFCDNSLVQVFDRWFDWISNTANGFIAISGTIRDEVRDEVQRRLGHERAASRWFDFFHLGSELDRLNESSSVRPAVKKLFTSGRAIYLMVSTIEPRKNHAYLLDAFEHLWQEGSDVILCFIGRIGWKNERLIERVKKHPQLKQRLFMFNDLSDVELEYCYSRARALVFPSFAEGFGLPLVEAMQRGLPVMASEIPVFHEIGGEFVSYFDLSQPESLAAQIRQFEAHGIFPATRQVADWSWLNWEDSARQLVKRVMHQVETQQHAQSSYETDHCAE
ncbi:glycosyltransferase family 1 protein [Collimonas sp.]|jgi:glycosyltransferase involved in cell wall biosynthesis|uniref:glycosyltransferase family 4 protein n=1 Tax=Collimonas sp. TaxID=1963772 RepID=UPI002D0C4F3D|nr:glycosyltransferase family 1 protein [Collimonas sp.]HWW08047.1 glycosyltransferase family 1 protein [Collimonas sp.]